jgi:hypothetical protein
MTSRTLPKRNISPCSLVPAPEAGEFVVLILISRDRPAVVSSLCERSANLCRLVGLKGCENMPGSLDLVLMPGKTGFYLEGAL